MILGRSLRVWQIQFLMATLLICESLNISSLEAGVCSKILGTFNHAKTSVFRRIDSLEEFRSQQLYQMAKERGQVVLGAMAILENIKARHRDLFSGKWANLAYRTILNELREDMASDPKTPGYEKGFLFSQRVLSHSLSATKSLAWITFGFFHPLRLRKKGGDYLSDLQSIIEIELVGSPLDQSEFFKQSSEYLKSIIPFRKINRNWNLKRFIPALLGSLLFLSGHHPIKNILASQRGNIYTDLHFLSDLSNRDARFDPREKKVSILIDSGAMIEANVPMGGFISALTKDMNPKDTLAIVSEIKYLARETSVHQIDSWPDFLAKLDQSSDADLIIIYAHGLPGSFKMGGIMSADVFEKDLPKTHLKSDSAMIYFSCSYGQPVCRLKDAKHEPFIRFFKNMTDTNNLGVVAASQNTLCSVNILRPATKEPWTYGQKSEFISSSITGFAIWVSLGIGILQPVLYLYEMDSGPIAISSYDLKTDEVTFTRQGFNSEEVVQFYNAHGESFFRPKPENKTQEEWDAQLRVEANRFFEEVLRLARKKE